MFISLDGYIEKPSGFAGPTWSADVEQHWSRYALGRNKLLLLGCTNFLFNKAFWRPPPISGYDLRNLLVA